MRYPEDNNFQINKQLMRDRRSEKKGKQREREREKGLREKVRIITKDTNLD